jgi:pyruvate carboxylase subunit B
VLIYALYPTTGMRFLRWKYGLEEPPPETRPKTLEDIKREDELIARAKANIQAEAVAVADPPQPPASAGEALAAEPPPAETEETTVTAPMPGLIIRYDVKVGDKVKAGDNIVVLEAMKMAIDLPSPVDGVVKEIKFKAGDNVARDDVLAVIA